MEKRAKKTTAAPLTASDDNDNNSSSSSITGCPPLPNQQQSPHQKYQLTNKGKKVPIASKFMKGKLVAFESLLDTSKVAYDFAKQVQDSNPKLRVFYMRFPTYFEIEKNVLDFMEDYNSSIIENNIRYFEDENVRRTIDNLNEYQVNNRLNIFSSINYIHMLPILARINKINHLHTHYNLIVVANYINSIRAFAINSQHVYKCLRFVYEQYVAKADQTFMLDATATQVKKDLARQKYEYFFDEDIDRYRIALLNNVNQRKHKNKLNIVEYDGVNTNKTLYNVLSNFFLFQQYVNKTVFH